MNGTWWQVTHFFSLIHRSPSAWINGRLRSTAARMCASFVDESAAGARSRMKSVPNIFINRSRVTRCGSLAVFVREVAAARAPQGRKIAERRPNHQAHESGDRQESKKQAAADDFHGNVARFRLHVTQVRH